MMMIMMRGDESTKGGSESLRGERVVTVSLFSSLLFFFYLE